MSEVTITKYRKQFKTRVPGASGWIDPFPGIEGTEPEKRVYAELVRRRIPFKYKYAFGDIEETPEIEMARPDFDLPDYKIAIFVVTPYFLERFGSYVDSLAYQESVLIYWGYKVLFWFMDDIENRLDELFSKVPEFNPPLIQGDPYEITWLYPHVLRRVQGLARTGGARPKQARIVNWRNKGV